MSLTREELKTAYRRTRHRNLAFTVAFALVAALMVFLTLGMGVYNISIPDAIGTLFHHLTGDVINTRDDMYVWDVRLPRALTALFVGAGLSVCGAVMQSTLKNPLADPYTMGVSSAAFFGAVLSIILGISVVPGLAGDYATVANAFIFSLISVAIIILLGKFRKVTPTVMILVGIAVMYIFSSGTQYFMVTADQSSLAEAYSWRVGTLSDASWETLPIIAVGVTVIGAVLILLNRKINILSTDESYSQTVGENVQRLRVIMLLLVALMTATIVSFTGTIGFIGLVCPHIVRMFVGSNPRYLLPASMAFGAAFMIVIDSIAKVTGANGLPVGVISALIGGPIFAYLLLKQRKSAW